MRFGAVILGYSILSFILFMFGIMQPSDSFVIGVLTGEAGWNEALIGDGYFLGIGELGFEVTSIISLMTIIAITIGGIALASGTTIDRHIIFGFLLAMVLTLYLEMLLPIVNVFPENIRILGWLIYGILSFILIWTAIEFWGGSE